LEGIGLGLKYHISIFLEALRKPSINLSISGLWTILKIGQERHPPGRDVQLMNINMENSSSEKINGGERETKGKG
jgi:hypothetical protein